MKLGIFRMTLWMGAIRKLQTWFSSMEAPPFLTLISMRVAFRRSW
jgi:hypothetical protein